MPARSLRFPGAALVVAALAPGLGCPAADPPLAGFGEACVEHRDCSAAYLCFEGRCAPDDIEVPDEVGDGDGDESGVEDPWLTGEDWEVPDCDALLALEAEAHTCDRGFLLGEGVYDDSLLLQPAVPADFDGCEVITGDVAIEVSTVTDLSFLGGLRGVCGHLSIAWNEGLTSLVGLGDLAHAVGGIRIAHNPHVESVAPLGSLREAGELYLNGNGLLDVDGLGALRRVGRLQLSSEQLANLDGLAALETAGSVWLSYLPALSDLGPVLSGGRRIGEVTLIGLDAVSALPELDGSELGGDLWIVDSGVNDLTGLRGGDLTRVHRVRIAEVRGLSSLDGLEGLGPELTGLELLENPDLASLAALENVTRVTREVVVRDNPSLTSLSGLGNLQTVGSLVVVGNPALSTCEARDVLAGTTATGSLDVYGNQGPDTCE